MAVISSASERYNGTWPLKLPPRLLGGKLCPALHGFEAIKNDELETWNYILENLKGFEVLFWWFCQFALIVLYFYFSFSFKLGRPSSLNKLNQTYAKALSLQTDFLSN